MQYIDVNAATTDIAGNCGANQLSSNVILAALIWSSRHRQALPRRWLSARQAPHMNLQPCTNASSWSMMCPVTHRPSSAGAPHCPCSANSGMQNRTSCPAGTSRTWVRIDAGAHVHDRYQQFWTVFGGAQCESQPTWLPELAALESNCKAIATLRHYSLYYHMHITTADTCVILKGHAFPNTMYLQVWRSLVYLSKGMKLFSSAFQMFEHVNSLQKLVATTLGVLMQHSLCLWRSEMIENSRLVPSSCIGQPKSALSI
ncbi:unnamed protein product [Miscanthus lutarioriparius]|uniref:Uncharacterized protein n=1 Tax=Miscanthus lutarioriparius TaxID=422564 RepID=A0A811RYM0_9POAL|nr:unnamed protein product [Miscanthus lutarioriparius]